MYKREHVRCLEEFFDGTVISEDYDHGQICEEYEPKWVVFEIGIQFLTAHRLHIRNTNS
jgi:hypothetical protein